MDKVKDFASAHKKGIIIFSSGVIVTTAVVYMGHKFKKKFTLSNLALDAADEVIDILRKHR